MYGADAIEKVFREQIPLTRAMGVRVVQYDGKGLVLSAPLESNHNHLNTAFGGSLHALATLSGYGWLWLELQDPAVHVVPRESHVSYRRPVTGELIARCDRPEEAVVERFKHDFAAKGKARIALQSVIEEGGKPAVVFTGEFVALR